MRCGGMQKEPESAVATTTSANRLTKTCCLRKSSYSCNSVCHAYENRRAAVEACAQRTLRQAYSDVLCLDLVMRRSQWPNAQKSLSLMTNRSTWITWSR